MNDPEQFIAPMLAVTATQPFDDAQWRYEVKWDGYRCQIHWTGHLQIFSRAGGNLLKTFPDLADIAQALNVPVILDGELIAWEDGKPSYTALQQRRRAVHRIMVFDCLYADGDWLCTYPLKMRLEQLNKVVSTQGKLVVADGVIHHGMALWLSVLEHQLEGVMAKQLDSPYEPGKRVKYWQKFVAMTRKWAVVSYVSMSPAGQWLWWVGLKGSEASFIGKLVAPSGWEPDVRSLTRMDLSSTAIWRLAYPLMVEVEYRELTTEGKMRHGRIRRWRIQN